jgi:hypothetical protein
MNPSAFPLNTSNAANPGAFDPEPGMDLRDWLAGQALAGLTANSGYISSTTWESAPNLVIASRAYSLADAMLAERAKARGEA